ncbi:GNAT family N-acetyltransferase [Methylophilus flavus]|uniref:GNAT family N-acetyltransferase n=1 Tax=Methylophilus flavus TaxID=640084 RepID=A0ABW3PDJ6_9PROT
MTSQNISLRHARSGAKVDALLHENIDTTFAKLADDTWETFLSKEKEAAALKGMPEPMLEHDHWRWEHKIGLSANLLSMPSFGVECDDQPQGIMLLFTDGYLSKSKATLHQPLVYLPYISTAPWNLPGFTSEPKYRGVGTILLSAAIQTSMELGFKGRLGLYSLPGAESFYECYKFESLGIDTRSSLKYYELSAESAAEFLS